jgi:hypothetical protein
VKERWIEKSSSAQITSMGQLFPSSPEVGSDLSIDSDNEALGRVRNAVIEALEKMEVTLEIDEQLQLPSDVEQRDDGSI